MTLAGDHHQNVDSSRMFGSAEHGHVLWVLNNSYVILEIELRIKAEDLLVRKEANTRSSRAPLEISQDE